MNELSILIVKKMKVLAFTFTHRINLRDGLLKEWWQFVHGVKERVELGPLEHNLHDLLTPLMEYRFMHNFPT